MLSTLSESGVGAYFLDVDPNETVAEMSQPDTRIYSRFGVEVVDFAYNSVSAGLFGDAALEWPRLYAGMQKELQLHQESLLEAATARIGTEIQTADRYLTVADIISAGTIKGFKEYFASK